MAACTSVKSAISILDQYQSAHHSQPESVVKDAARFISNVLKNSDLSQVRSDTEITEKIQHRDIKVLDRSSNTTLSLTELQKLQVLVRGNPHFKEKDRARLHALTSSAFVSTEARAEKLIQKLVREPDPGKREQELKQYLMQFAFIGSRGVSSDIRREKMTLIGQVRSQWYDADDPAEVEALEHLERCLDPTNHNFPIAAELRSGVVSSDLQPPVSEAVATHMHSPERMVSLSRSPEALSEHRQPGVQLHAMRKERLWRLNHLEDVYRASIQDPNQLVRPKTMGPTTGWYVGSCIKTGEAPFEKEMEEFGRNHEIPIVTDSRETLEHSLVFSDDLDAAYPQDFIEFTPNEIRTPYTPPIHLLDKTKKMIDASIYQDRKGRFENYNHPSVGHSTISTSMVGQVLEKGQQEKALRLGLALDVPVSMSLTYSEGGNTISALKPNGEPYIIIGRDSFTATKAILEQDLGRTVSEGEVKMAFGVDYGIPVEDIYFIEQPGDFHLDMNMAIIGDGVIAVNDAVQAFHDFEPEYERYLREEMGIRDKEMIQKFKAQTLAACNLKKPFEDKAAADLEAQGFEVRRVAGSFSYKQGLGPHLPVMNFFNMVSGQAPNGDRVIVAMGCIDGQYENRFREMVQDLAPDAVYFLSADATKTSLAKHGGISCRSKTI